MTNAIESDTKTAYGMYIFDGARIDNPDRLENQELLTLWDAEIDTAFEELYSMYSSKKIPRLIDLLSHAATNKSIARKRKNSYPSPRSRTESQENEAREFKWYENRWRQIEMRNILTALDWKNQGVAGIKAKIIPPPDPTHMQDSIEIKFDVGYGENYISKTSLDGFARYRSKEEIEDLVRSPYGKYILNRPSIDRAESPSPEQLLHLWESEIGEAEDEIDSIIGTRNLAFLVPLMRHASRNTSEASRNSKNRHDPNSPDYEISRTMHRYTNKWQEIKILAMCEALKMKRRGDERVKVAIVPAKQGAEQYGDTLVVEISMNDGQNPYYTNASYKELKQALNSSDLSEFDSYFQSSNEE
ncbi:MAG TPA: hypothetical protein VG965_03075 [Patescibacteria group bacterium]|nr:hypothetical protein [Patescibacteria group bacterium]